MNILYLMQDSEVKFIHLSNSFESKVDNNLRRKNFFANNM